MKSWDFGILESEDYFAADEKENAEKKEQEARVNKGSKAKTTMYGGEIKTLV